MMPVSGGLRSSSAELIASSGAWMRSRLTGSRRNDGAFLRRVAAAVTSQVQSLSYYIDLLHFIT
jgi:hypothetical protein